MKRLPYQPLYSRFFSTPSLRLPRPGLISRNLQTNSGPVFLQSESWVRQVLGRYDLQILEPITVLPGALRNETWELKTTEGLKVLKRYEKVMYYSQICHEHTLLTHLEKKNYPTVRLVRANDGETIIQNDGRIYAMFDYLDGYYKFDDYLYVPSQDSWFLTQMGLALSRLHYALRDFDPPEPSKLGFLSMDQEKLEGRDWTLEKLFQNRSASKELITNQTRSIHDRLLKLAGWIEDTFYTIDDQLTNSRPERCIIHGDFGPYNILVRPHSPLVVLDFELSRLDWRLVDLITAFSTTTAKSPSWLNLDKIRQILAGYQSGYPIPTEQLHLLPLVWKYQILRRIILSWSAYLERGEKHRENEIHKRLAQFQWVQQNQEKLARLA